MVTTYITNKGAAQTTVIDRHNHKTTNELKWDADYNGEYANLKVDVSDNGKKNKYRVQLNNNDLANILSVPSVNMPIHRRLENDFLQNQGKREGEPIFYQINTNTTNQNPIPLSSPLLPDFDYSLKPIRKKMNKRAKLTKKQKIAKTNHYKTPSSSRNSRNSRNLVANFFRKLI